jgi:membrane-bound metal-dependent hydrolase YbcI (DUF457 family)
MASSIGHAIAGVTAAWSADLVPGNRAWRTAPPDTSWYGRAGNGLTVACAVIAALPDADLLFHSHRDYTHSIGAVLIVFVLAAVAARVANKPVMRVALMCAAALATHLVIDWLSVDKVPPYGIRAFWPFSDGWYISSWTPFPSTERYRFFSAAAFWINVRAVTCEVLILAPIAAAIFAWRRRSLRA